MPGVETFLKLGIADREVAHVQDFITHGLKIEQDESSHLGLFLQDTGIRVDEQRTCKSIFTRLSRFRGGGYAIHGKDIESVSIFLIVGIAKVSDGKLTAFHTLHEDVIIFR